MTTLDLSYNTQTGEHAAALTRDGITGVGLGRTRAEAVLSAYAWLTEYRRPQHSPQRSPEYDEALASMRALVIALGAALLGLFLIVWLLLVIFA